MIMIMIMIIIIIIIIIKLKKSFATLWVPLLWDSVYIYNICVSKCAWMDLGNRDDY